MHILSIFYESTPDRIFFALTWILLKLESAPGIKNPVHASGAHTLLTQIHRFKVKIANSCVELVYTNI